MRSPGQSPEKKKPARPLYPNMTVKATLATADPKPKAVRSGYMIWGMVARPELTKLMPSLGTCSKFCALRGARIS
jgi:hypothetical protein